MPIEMKIPTCEEWDRMMDICDENNAVTYWKGMFSWVNADREDRANYNLQMYRGGDSARSLCYHGSLNRYPLLGFRPVFDNLPLNGSDNGAVKVIGTLYMDGVPVRVPSNPTYDGDILDYVPDAKLEMREPLDDPQYQVRAIKVGSTYIADRALLKNINYEDVMSAITTKEN